MDISRYLGVNYGSLILIEYVAIQNVVSFTQSIRGRIGTAGIVFTPGAGWTKVYCSEDTMGYQQVLVKDNNGESWQQNVTGFIPGDQDTIESGLLAISKTRFIARVTRPDGNIKIIGTKINPLEFTIDSNSQTTIPGAAGTIITFAGLTEKRSLIYTS
jgi:hypothetical protein